VRFTVADSGGGLTPQDAAHIFDRFWQGDVSDRRGFGLGLAICKGIVEGHKGELSVTSEPGKGTDFSFWLPAAGEPASSLRR
jgi:signal transduction histidine kinase